jgi:hypothetical protein
MGVHGTMSNVFGVRPTHTSDVSMLESGSDAPPLLTTRPPASDCVTVTTPGVGGELS